MSFLQLLVLSLSSRSGYMYMYAGMSVDLHEPSAHNNNKLLAPDKRVKVKNSPPKSLSAGSWPTVNQQLTDSWPTVNQQLTNS